MLPFLILSILTTAFALGVVFSRNAVNSALSLLLAILGTAAIFVQLDALFLAALVIIVYAGAVATLFLFIVMLINPAGKNPDSPNGDKLPPQKSYSLLATRYSLPLLATALLAIALALLARQNMNTAVTPDKLPPAPTLAEYGQQLFTTYLLPLEIVGPLLLIAMLGVILISKKQPENFNR